MRAISFSSVDLPLPFWPTIPNDSPGSTSMSTSRSAHSWRRAGRCRVISTSFSDRAVWSRSRNSRDRPRPWMAPRIALPELELDGKAVLVARQHPEAEHGHRRPDHGHVDELGRRHDEPAPERAADALDVGRDRVQVAEEDDDRLHLLRGRDALQ